jgi:hypothetical protein
LGLDTKQATNLAYGLSKKYRRQGRPAQGFAGLAIPGSIPTQLSEQLNPISGGLIDLAFRELDRRLS